MSRKLRLKCPACQTLIETSVEDEPRIALQCAACQHQFTAKVPPRAEPLPQALVAAKPVAAPVAAGATAARPVAAAPIHAAPIHAAPTTSVPISSSPMAHDPLFGGANDFSFPVAPVAYQPVRKRKPLNLRPLFTIGGSILGVCLAIGIGLYAWRWVANTDWSTFSVTRDTPEGIMAEVSARMERMSKDNENILPSMTIQYEQVKKGVLDSGSWSEHMLVRAVRVGKAPGKLKAEYREKMAALVKNSMDRAKAKFDELKASGKLPNQPTAEDATRLMEMMLEQEVMDAVAVSTALTNYMDDAFFDLPSPTNDTEKIYYDEADLVHEYLKLLTLVRNTSQSKSNAEKIEKLTDQMMELVARRSKLPPNRFEQVPREYVTKDKGLSAAQKALVARIKRDARPDEQLKDAVANFNDARDLLMEASTGKSEVSLRGRLAEFRKIRSESTLHPPGDLFHEGENKPQPRREMVAKSRDETQPDPVRQPSQPTSKPQPAPDSLADNRPASGSSSLPSDSPFASNSPSQPQTNSRAESGSSSAPMSTPSSAIPATDASANSSAPSPLAPGLREHFLRGMQAGMQEGFNGMGRGMPQSSGPVGPGSVNPGATPPGAMNPAPGTMGGYQPPGIGGPGPSGFGGGPSNMPPPMRKDESVKIVISQSQQDPNELVKRLAAKLESGNYSMNATNGKITLQIKYAGDLDRVVKLIDFGKVTLIDTPDRTIHVNGR